jgi:RNA polymerase sigma-70 factor (ECF subfamily)
MGMGDPGTGAQREDVTASLVGHVKAGDRQRFDGLYERLSPALYAWAYLRIQPAMRGTVDPEDLIQEVWFRAVRRLDTHDPQRSSFRAWIFTIARNVLLESFRRARRSPAWDAPGGSTTRLLALGNVPDEVTQMTHRVARNEELRRFLDDTGVLSPEDRAILAHCGLEGRTCAEVATRLELTEAAVIKRWQRLRARLRQQRWARELIED